MLSGGLTDDQIPPDSIFKRSYFYEKSIEQ